MLRIRGHSDDTVIVEGGRRGDPDGADTSARDGVHVEVTIGEPAACVVRGFYSERWNEPATWAFAVQQAAEDRPIPWPVRIVNAHAYSVAVEVDCPADTPVAVRKVAR